MTMNSDGPEEQTSQSAKSTKTNVVHGGPMKLKEAGKRDVSDLVCFAFMIQDLYRLYTHYLQKFETAMFYSCIDLSI